MSSEVKHYGVKGMKWGVSRRDLPAAKRGPDNPYVKSKIGGAVANTLWSGALNIPHVRAGNWAATRELSRPKIKANNEKWRKKNIDWKDPKNEAQYKKYLDESRDIYIEDMYAMLPNKGISPSGKYRVQAAFIGPRDPAKPYKIISSTGDRRLLFAGTTRFQEKYIDARQKFTYNRGYNRVKKKGIKHSSETSEKVDTFALAFLLDDDGYVVDVADPELEPKYQAAFENDPKLDEVRQAVETTLTDLMHCALVDLD